MYKNYFTVAWRTLLKSKGYSFINIAGLAVGLSACLLISLYVKHELSYDRFHEKDAISMQKWVIDEDYMETMGMFLLEGRNFSKEIAADTVSLILNESGAKFLGNRDILEKKLYHIEDEETKALKEFRVIGIVKDFNFSSLREPVKPLAFRFCSDDGGMTVRIQGTEITQTVSAIENKWKSVASDLPFEYSFINVDFDQLYKGEKQSGKLITYFASLSILISCLGLFGLAALMAEQRTTEIGIRKVMGASVPGITALLSKNFLVGVGRGSNCYSSGLLFHG